MGLANTFHVMHLTERCEEEKASVCTESTSVYLEAIKYIPLEVDAHLNDDDKEEADHAQHDDAQEDAQPLCGIKPEEGQDDDSVGNAGADPKPDFGTPDELVRPGNSQDSVETSGPAVCLEKSVADTDTGRHDPTYQGCVENCQAVLVPENCGSI